MDPRSIGTLEAIINSWKPPCLPMTFEVPVREALLPEEAALIEKPGQSNEERRDLLNQIVTDCILLGKPLPPLVKRYDLATTGARALQGRNLKVRDEGGALLAHFNQLRHQGRSVKLAEIETAALFNISPKTVQRYRMKRMKQKSGHF
jgi:hypothetical protein